MRGTSLQVCRGCIEALKRLKRGLEIKVQGLGK